MITQVAQPPQTFVNIEKPQPTPHRLISDYDSALAALSWALSGYRFGRYKSNGGETPKLCVPEGSMPRGSRGLREASRLGVILSPANDMDPEALEAAVLILAAI
jgi:leucyl aminopeptidase